MFFRINKFYNSCQAYVEKLMLGYVHLLVNSRSEIALARVINTPERELDHKAFTDEGLFGCVGPKMTPDLVHHGAFSQSSSSSLAYHNAPIRPLMPQKRQESPPPQEGSEPPTKKRAKEFDPAGALSSLEPKIAEMVKTTRDKGVDALSDSKETLARARQLPCPAPPLSSVGTAL